MNIYPVIMAGGSGTRFWPRSRRALPKQFLPLASEQPLLVDTKGRLGELALAENFFVVCGKDHAAKVGELLPELSSAQVLVEPQARNTAPAIGLAAIHVAHRDPQGIMVVLPSDHHIADNQGFRHILKRAAKAAQTGELVTIGIKPTHPETGYGYIQLGDELQEEEAGQAGVHRVRRFVEKPDLEKAKEYVAEGSYLWNAGIFVLRADAILKAIDTHLPGLAKALARIAPSIGSADYEAVLEENFPLSEATSIDYGVMERAERIACLPGDFGWSDVGSFAALPEVRAADGQGNVVDGRALLIDSEGCVVLGEKRLIAGVGLQDLVIVDSEDVLLVLPKERAQEVRKLVDALEQKNEKELL